MLTLLADTVTITVPGTCTYTGVLEEVICEGIMNADQALQIAPASRWSAAMSFV